MRRIEKVAENNKNKAKDLSDLTHFDIKLIVEGIGLEVIINAYDPLDCVTLAGAIISHLRRWGKEPTVVVLP